MLPSLAALSAASLTGACGGGHTRAAKAASTEAETGTETETEPVDTEEGDVEDAPVVEEHEEAPAPPRRLG